VGVLVTPASTFDEAIDTRQSGTRLMITPRDQVHGSHFSGFVSDQAYDLRTTSFSVSLVRCAGITIFAAGVDPDNWFGFQTDGKTLTFESRMNGHATSKKAFFDEVQHRYLRIRASDVAPTVVWESSANGRSWTLEHVQTHTIPISSLHVALSAGTTTAGNARGTAIFEGLKLEPKP